MIKARALLILGIWTAILPYLGFPYNVKNILFSITGFIFIYISLVIYKEVRVHRRENKIADKVFENFSENTGFIEENQSTS